MRAGWEPCGRRGQQHCCWESLRDNSLVNLKVQPSQTELLFRSVDNSFFAMRMGGMGRDGSYGSYGKDGREWEPWETYKKKNIRAVEPSGCLGMLGCWFCLPERFGCAFLLLAEDVDHLKFLVVFDLLAILGQ